MNTYGGNTFFQITDLDCLSMKSEFLLNSRKEENFCDCSKLIERNSIASVQLPSTTNFVRLFASLIIPVTSFGLDDEKDDGG